MARSMFIIPKNPRDKLFILVMPVLIPLVVIFEFGVVLPEYHNGINSTVVFHVVAAAYIFMNIFGNIFMVVRTDASGRASFLPSVQKPDWRYCYECKLNAPPRSYHCYECNECILKRDHHCVFTGNCIGYHNHRYYLVGLSYIFLGALYVFFYQFEFCFARMGSPTWVKLVSMCAPHFNLLMGYITLFGFFLSVLQILALVVILLTGYLLVTQTVAVLRGQTQHERKNDERTFDLGWRRNLTDVLGSHWLLVWLSPTVVSPLLGDGLRFTAHADYEDIKRL